jgi:hypothetical protein
MGVAGALAGAVSERLDAPLLSLSAAEVTAELREDFACVQQLSARLLALVQHACTLGVPAAQGASATRVWLAETLAISIRQASALSRLAAQLPAVPVVASALAAGTVNVEQAQVIAATIADLPSDIGVDALTFLCQRALQDGQLPESGGEKPQIVVTMRWEDLRDQVGHGLLDTGDLLTPDTVRRLACDARIIPAVLGGHRQVLDVGRARRLIDGPLRRAPVLRDKGCTWPGCDRPPRWTDGHHIRHWSDGGPTSLDNAVLLCGHHHREIHRTQWTVRIGTHGHPEFQPPAHLDALQRWRRNRIHRRT